MSTATAPTVNELMKLVQLIEYDLGSLAGGSKSSSVQARKKLSQVSKMATALRSDVLAFSKTLSKPRKKKVEPVVEDEGDEPEDIEDLAEAIEELEVTPAPVKKKRGRRKK